MNNAELIEKLAGDVGTTKVGAKAAVDGVLAIIQQALAKGEEVSLNGFGKFTVKARPERDGRNPQTGEKMVFPASKTVNFKPSKTLKDAL